MKLRFKFLSALLAILILVSMLVSCNAPDKDGIRGDENGGANSPINLDDNFNVIDERMLIREAEFTIQTKDLETLVKNLHDKAKSLGGFVDQEVVTEDYAKVVIKIPSKNLDSFVDYTKGSGNVVKSKIETKDVTLEHIDLESRIKSLEAQLESLRNLLNRQSNYLNEIMQIMERIKDVEYELDKYNTALNTLKNRVAYSDVTIYIHQMEVIAQVSAKGMWGEIANKFLNNLNRVLNFLKDVFVWFVSSTPYFALIAIIIVIFVFIFKFFNKLKKRRDEKKLEQLKAVMASAKNTTTQNGK